MTWSKSAVKKQVKGGIAFLREYPSAECDDCASSLTCLSRIEFKTAVVTMKPVSLVKKMSHRVQSVKKRRRSSRFSLMESRESTSSLKSYFEVRKKLSTSFEKVDEYEFDQQSFGISPKPAKKLKAEEKPQAQKLDTFSFGNSVTPNSVTPNTISPDSKSSDSSFGTKISNMLQEHEMQLKDLKSRQKEQLQILLQNLSRVDRRGSKNQRDNMCSPSVSLSLDNNDFAVGDPSTAVVQVHEEPVTPQQDLSRHRKTPRRTGNGRRWHGYSPGTKGWWMV